MAGGRLPTTSVAESRLGVQAWLGDGPFDPGCVTTGGWPQEARYKPDHGFFTSSWDGHTSAWIEWQATQPGRASEKRIVFLLVPDPGAVLYVIKCPDDFDALVEAYPHHQLRPEPCPDWRALGEDPPFDAIHMTAAAVSDQTRWYASAWMVESTLWFHPKLRPLDQT